MFHLFIHKNMPTATLPHMMWCATNLKAAKIYWHVCSFWILFYETYGEKSSHNTAEGHHLGFFFYHQITANSLLFSPKFLTMWSIKLSIG